MADSRRIFAIIARVIATLIVVAIAVLLGWLAWQHYVYAPWTRDARVQADVLNIAPQVSGVVSRVNVTDNGYVHKGDLLFAIEPVRFVNAVAQAKAALAQAKANRKYTARNARRLERLPHGGVSTQDLQQAQSRAAMAAAAVAEAKASLAQAKQNLEWTKIHAPVDGYVTHLLLNVGDYAGAGNPAMTLVDAESFRIIAYFEETKLPRIEPGDRVRIKLMSSDEKLRGNVLSIGRGIAVANIASGERNLPDVNPVFQWVRLAQRVPVIIEFDQRPADRKLSVGLTATVHVLEDQGEPDTPPARATPRQGLVGPPNDSEQGD